MKYSSLIIYFVLLVIPIRIILSSDNPDRAFVGEKVQLSVLAVYETGITPGNEFVFSWSFTDLPNIYHQHFFPGDQEPDTVLVTWQQPGLKTVKVIVRDDLGRVGEREFQINIYAGTWLPIVVKGEGDDNE